MSELDEAIQRNTSQNKRGSSIVQNSVNEVIKEESKESIVEEDRSMSICDSDENSSSSIVTSEDEVTSDA